MFRNKPERVRLPTEPKYEEAIEQATDHEERNRQFANS